MKASILLLLILSTPVAVLAAQDDPSPVLVVNSKWARDQQPAENAVSVSSTPAPAMISANKLYEKQRRENTSAGERDPNADTVDNRSAELDRIVQDSRKPNAIDGFAYLVRVQNATKKPIKLIFWEYRFKEVINPKNVTRRQFLCRVELKPDKQKEMQAFSLSGPADVVNVKSLGKDADKRFAGEVFINRVEFNDGSSWERAGWSLDEVKLTAIARDDRNLPLCRGL